MLRIEFVADVTSTAGYAAHTRMMLRAFSQCQLEAKGIKLTVTNRTKDVNQAHLFPEDAEVISQYLDQDIGPIDGRVFFEPAQWLDWQKGVKTISFCQWESTRIRNYAPAGQETFNWVSQFNKCDLVMSSCNDAIQAYIDSGVETPCVAVPGPIFPHTVEGELPIDGLTFNSKTGTPIARDKRVPVIGYMAQWSPRKNIEAFVRDLTIGFKRNEVVGLLKTYRGNSFGQPDQIIEAMRIVRDSCRREKPPKIIVVTDQLTDPDILRFFNTVDIYYAPSRGEAFGVPVSMAAAAGCWPLVPEFGGPRDYLPPECIIPGSFSPCLGMNAYDSDQFWCNIDEEQAIGKLKEWVQLKRKGLGQDFTDLVRDQAMGRAGPDTFTDMFATAVKSVFES